MQRLSHQNLSCLTTVTPVLTLARVLPMKMRWLFVVVLIGLLFVLSPMAFASPPDPSWLGGFWDDADFDDVILHLTWCCPALSSRSEEHTSELQSRLHLVCRLLLEKKKKIKYL